MATDRETLARFKHHVDALKVHRDPVEGPSLKKPLLLLLVISRLERGLLRQNEIRFREVEKELAELIREFCWRTMSASPCPEQPFERMASSPLWRLHVAEGVVRGARKALPRRALRDPRTFATLEDDIFLWLSQSREARAVATGVVLERWCPSEKHAPLRTRLGLR
ncbi:MAG: hypothetical protein R3B09_26920 [Nannocystaceae bacterium]